MLRDVEKHPAVLEPFMRHRVEICNHYPDLFLEFIKEIRLVREVELTPSGKNTALLTGATQFLTSGSKQRSPRTLWAKVLEAGSRNLRAAVHQKIDAATVREHRAMSMLKSGYRLDRIDPDALQRIMVCSLLIPFEGAVGVSLGGVSRPETTLLCLVVRAASKQEDFTIFDSLVVKGMLQFKWDNYGAMIFQSKFTMDTVHLLCFSVFSFTGVQYEHSNWLNMLNSSHGVTIACAGILTLLGSTVFLVLEIRQLLMDGGRAYFNGPGKYIDLCSLSSQIGVAFLFISRSEGSMKALAAWSVLVSFFKILNFSRGFASFGPLVRMIIKVAHPPIPSCVVR